MKQDEFICIFLGKPWVNRAANFDACDCWGLVLLYYRYVLDIELPIIKGYSQGECSTAQGWQSDIHHWQEVNKPITAGLVFTCYKDGAPTHVGITISSTKVLHSRGFPCNPGKVEIHSIRAIETIYGKMTYHKFIGAKNA